MLLPGCVIRQAGAGAGAGQPRYTLQLCRPDTSHVAGDAGSIWLAADSEAEFAEWSEMLDMAANKRRSQVNVVAMMCGYYSEFVGGPGRGRCFTLSGGESYSRLLTTMGFRCTIDLTW